MTTMGRFKRREWVWPGGAVAALGLYLGASALAGGPGLPLDDGWIHQTYARNLAQAGRWEYVPGAASAGSTAPLWTLWLALGYWLRLPPLIWAYLSGLGALLWLAAAGRRLWQLLAQAFWPGHQAGGWLAATTLVFSWPLVWAAGSGMETLAFAALGLHLAVVFLAEDGSSAWRWAFGLGLGAGLLMLLRPDGLVLLLLLGPGVAGRPAGLRARLGATGLFVLAAALALAPYFWFNFSLSGQWWPNTFYAKQAEYQALLSVPLAQRLARLLFFSLGGPELGWRGISGAHLLLVPGILVTGRRLVQGDWAARRLRWTLPLGWAGGHVLLYAWRLPVTYQHGRYLLAALPVWVVLGLLGWRPILSAMARWPGMAGRLSRRVAIATFAALLGVFLLLGAQAYAVDVAFIEAEMMTVARWLNDHTPPDAVVAAHDIGALGYATERRLVDLAGLISPEVVPYINDENALARYLAQAGADYLVTAPGWPYRQLIQASGAALVYDTGYAWTRDQGFNNMAVYRLP